MPTNGWPLDERAPIPDEEIDAEAQEAAGEELPIGEAAMTGESPVPGSLL